MNGGASFTGNSIGDKVTYKCNCGRKLIGTPVAFCTGDEHGASFRPEMPFCQSKWVGGGGGVGRFYKVGVYVRFKKKIKWELCGLNTICVIIHNKIVVQFLITEHFILRMVLYT